MRLFLQSIFPSLSHHLNHLLYPLILYHWVILSVKLFSEWDVPQIGTFHSFILVYELMFGFILKKNALQLQSTTACRRIELLFSPWEGDVLTPWPTSHIYFFFAYRQSRRQDLNLRPLRPERSALPNWATPRAKQLVGESNSCFRRERATS